VAESAHHFDLLDQALLALVLAVGRLLRKGLHRVVPSVLHLLRQVHRREVSLPDLLLRLELLVEAALVEPGLEGFAALAEVGFRPQLIGVLLFALLEGEGGRGEVEGELDVEVEVDVESGAGGGLSDGALEEGEGEVALLGTVHGAGEE
jgi:hypothetical protein